MALRRLVALLLLAARAEDVHVVVTGSSSHALGVVACVSSVFAQAADPGRVVAHVVVAAADAAVFDAALACAVGGERRWRVVPFDETSPLGARVASKISVRHAKKQYLASIFNYARFYLGELLPAAATKVVWLDSDTIALGDVAELADAVLNGADGPAVAAVPRERPVCGTFLNCSDAAAMAALRDRGVDAARLNAFNAGVVVFHLPRWRRQGLTAAVEGWLELNRVTPVFALGTNPPLMLATNGAFERVSARWNCQVGSGHPCARGLQAHGRRLRDEARRARAAEKKAFRRDRAANATARLEALSRAWEASGETAGVLHWSGERKPWWAEGLANAPRFAGLWMAALGKGKACALRALPPDHTPNSTVVIPSSAHFPDVFAFRKGGALFEDFARVAVNVGRAYAAAERPADATDARKRLRARFLAGGGRPCGVVVVVLRGKLYADPRRPAGCPAPADGFFDTAERRALQTLHRAVRRVRSVVDRDRPDRLLSFRDALVFELAGPGAPPADHRFSYADAPAITCDAFDCAVDVTTAALDACFEAAGFGLLGERDVLSTVTVANLKLQPLVFDDAAARRGVVDDPSRKSLSKADRVRVGKRGFFSKQRAIKIDLRPSNTIKIGPGPEAGVDPGRGDGG